jgi:hypothetical protein
LAGHLVGLKLALLRNGLRRSNWPQQVGLALGALAGLPLAFGGFLLLALVPRAEPAAGLILVEVVFLLVFFYLPVLGNVVAFQDFQPYLGIRER